MVEPAVVGSLENDGHLETDIEKLPKATKASISRTGLFNRSAKKGKNLLRTRIAGVPSTKVNVTVFERLRQFP